MGKRKLLNVLNLGAGVQSTTVLLRSIHGELPKIDCAVFSDTGWEPKAVYRHLDWLEAVAAAKSTEKANGMAAERRQREAQRDAQKREAERLEKTFGQTLDALPLVEIKKLIAELHPDPMQRKLATANQPSTGPPVGALRVELLAEVERRWKEEN